MVAEAWIIKMGNQVSTNLKQVLLPENPSKKNPKSSNPKQTIGILSFEVANIMSKTINLHHSLSNSEISKLKSEIFTSEGIKTLISSNESHLLNLTLSEKLDDLNRVANVVSRLGKKCTEPALQGFEHVYDDVINGVIDVRKLGFLVKDMESMIKKMERFVTTTCNLYCEMEVMNELEQATKKFQRNKESCRPFEQKLMWQKQDVKHLQEASLWNQTYDKIVEMLARTVCTIFSRIQTVFGDSILRKTDLGSGSSPLKFATLKKTDLGNGSSPLKVETLKKDHIKKVNSRAKDRVFGSLNREIDSDRGEAERFMRAGDFNFPCGTNPGRLFLECLAMNSSVSNEEEEEEIDSKSFQDQFNESTAQRSRGSSIDKSSRKSRLALQTSNSTIGGSGLSLHYANVVIVLEKLLKYPHLIGEETRDDLYEMLPTSLKKLLKVNLRSYLKNISIYDAPLAHDWKETLESILSWLAPLAHNMIRWQSERNFEQHEIVKRTNVLLIETVYFADREKMEEVICKVLVGLNYICRYEQQRNALVDCGSSFDYEDCFEWQRQCQGGYVD